MEYLESLALEDYGVSNSFIFGNSLASLGVNLNEYNRLNKLSLEERVGEVLQQVRAYRNEVLEDKAVSILYNYWLSEGGELFTNSTLKPIFRALEQFDFRERGGLVIENFRRVSELIGENERKVVLSYSPAGAAAFMRGAENPYSGINYKDGQLYFYYREGDKVDSVAVKVGDEGVLGKLMPGVFELANRANSERERIESYLLNPVVSDFSIWEFLERDWGGDFIYEDKNGEIYNLRDVVFEVGERFRERRIIDICEGGSIEKILSKGEINSWDIFNIYAGEIVSYSDGGIISLGGSCGGREVSVSGLRGLLEGRRRDEFSGSGDLNFYRNDIMIERKQKGWSYHFGTCRVCERDLEVGPCEICKECEGKFDRGQIN